MTDMIERVARAIAEEAAMWGDEATRPEVRHALARAAIAAMREPTPGMVDAGGTDIIQSMDNTPDDLARDAYRAMIDAALAEGVAKPRCSICGAAIPVDMDPAPAWASCDECHAKIAARAIKPALAEDDTPRPGSLGAEDRGPFIAENVQIGPAAPIWRKAGDLLAEGDAMIDAAIERAAKPPNKPA